MCAPRSAADDFEAAGDPRMAQMLRRHAEHLEHAAAWPAVPCSAPIGAGDRRASLLLFDPPALSASISAPKRRKGNPHPPRRHLLLLPPADDPTAIVATWFCSYVSIASWEHADTCVCLKEG